MAYHDPSIAGKDRTGVLAALILRLGGSSREAIIHDYVLTRIGVEPHRESLTKKLQLFVGNNAQLEGTGMLALCSVPANAMGAFLSAMDEAFEGGVPGYLTGQLEFSQPDVDRMRANLQHTR